MKAKIFSLVTVLFFIVIKVSIFAGGTPEPLNISNIDMVQRYIEGGVLDERISNTGLALLAREDLQLLRNAIYARRGMIFQSNYLTEYFRKFTWYRPMSNNVESQLSELDRINLRNIQVFENARTNPSIQKRQLVGTWIDSFPAPAYCGEIKINNNNTIEVIDPQFEGYYKGRYTIENGFLIVLVTDQQDPDNGRWVTYQNPLRLVFPVWDLEEFEYGGYQVQIGYTKWFGGPN